MIATIIVPAVEVTVRRIHTIHATDELTDLRFPGNALEKAEECRVIWEEAHHGFRNSVIHAQLVADAVMTLGQERSGIHALHNFFQ